MKQRATLSLSGGIGAATGEVRRYALPVENRFCLPELLSAASNHQGVGSAWLHTSTSEPSIQL